MSVRRLFSKSGVRQFLSAWMECYLVVREMRGSVNARSGLRRQILHEIGVMSTIR